MGLSRPAAGCSTKDDDNVYVYILAEHTSVAQVFIYHDKGMNLGIPLFIHSQKHDHLYPENYKLDFISITHYFILYSLPSYIVGASSKT